MGTEVKSDEPPKAKDVTHPWRRQFFDCKDIGPVPPLNTKGFWKKPEHGISEKELKGDANNRRNGR
jgi:hypothetical protein